MIQWPDFNNHIEIRHNENKSFYETVEQSMKDYGRYIWSSDNDRQKCIDENNIWQLNIDYSLAYASSTLSGLLELAGGKLETDIIFPKYDISLILSCYRGDDSGTIDLLIDDGEWFENSLDEAFDNNEYWNIHWYPTTPIGSHSVSAQNLENLLKFARG